jgi:DNA repair protein RadC
MRRRRRHLAVAAWGRQEEDMEERNPDAAGKMLRYGIETLTDVELLALFLRTGTREKGDDAFA